MMHAYNRLISDRTSRLFFEGSSNPGAITKYIQIILCKPYLDAVEWLLAAPGTYISALVTDIRRWVLEPYLWEGTRLCGVPHSSALKRGAGYRYGVRHTTDTPHDTCGTRRYYHMGMLHRVGAPAVVSKKEVRYYQNGRLFRESGPVIIGRKFIQYMPGNRLGGLYLLNDRRIRFVGILSVVASSLHGNILIWIRPRNKLNSEYAVDNEGRLRNGSVIIKSNAFRDIIDVFRSYIETYPIEAICTREWRRGNAENVSMPQ